MDYEKAYKDALKRAKDCHVNENLSELVDNAQQLCEYIFPELKMSEDEKIKRGIIKFLKENKEFPEDWIAWLENIKTQDKQYNSEQDKKMFEIIHDEIFNRMIQISNGCKKRQEIESAFVWFCETFKLQSSKWSEEDEKMMQFILNYVNASASNLDFQNVKMWLKSLKNRVQPHWKPTEEQMEDLKYAINMVDKCCEDSLQSLFNNLKKL